MEPLSSLAIAAAVFQFIDFGGKLVIKMWHKYHTNTGKENEQIVADSKSLPEDLKGLRSSLREASKQLETESNMTTVSAARSRFITVRTECDQIAAELEHRLSEASEVLRVVPEPPNGGASGLKKIMSTQSRKGNGTQAGPSGVSDAAKEYQKALSELRTRLDRLKPQVTEAVIFCIL